MKCIFITLSIFLFQSSSTKAQNDETAIRQVLNGYLNAIYEADSTMVAKVTNENLQKSGHYYSPKSKKWSYSNMTYEELEHTAATYNLKKWIPENAPHEVTIFEIKERTASAKVEAIWGFDYVLLSKNENGKWLMDKVLWQSYSSKVTIDGTVTQNEWRDAKRVELTNGGKAFIKTMEDDLYVGIIGAEKGWVTVYISDEEKVYALHASAALGTSIYQADNKKWKNIQAFKWELRDTAMSAEAMEKRQTFYEKNGWVANVNETGDLKEREFKISNKFFKNKPLKFAIVYSSETDPVSLQYYPSTLSDATLDMELNRGNNPSDLIFDKDTWVQPVFKVEK